MNVKVLEKITEEFRSPILLAGWPGIGNVGVGAIDYLRRKLDALPFLELDLKEYFTAEAVMVEDGISKFPEMPSHVFYYIREPELIIFESEAQIGGNVGVSLMNQILDLATEWKVGQIYTAASWTKAMSYREPVQILGVANRKSIRDSLIPLGIESLKQGVISGLNGLLLGFAGLRDIEAACLLATLPEYAMTMPNPKASREIVRVFENLLQIQVDLAEIDRAVEQMDETMADIEEQIRATFTNLKNEEGEEEGLEEVDDEKVPQYVMERIERLFGEVKVESSSQKAALLKRELDRWNLYSLYEDRFLDLFRKDQDSGTSTG